MMIELWTPLLRFSGVPTTTPGPPSAVSATSASAARSQARRKAGLLHQVLRRIAGDEQLGEQHEVGALAGRIGARLARLGEIAGDVADDRVELRDGDAQDVSGAWLLAMHGM